MQYLHIYELTCYFSWEMPIILRNANQWYSWNRRDLKNFMAPFYGRGWIASRLQNHYKETVYFLHTSSWDLLLLLINFRRMKGWVNHGATWWFRIDILILDIKLGINEANLRKNELCFVYRFGVIFYLPYIVFFSFLNGRL